MDTIFHWRLCFLVLMSSNIFYYKKPTWSVTVRSSMFTSRVKKSAPIVAWKQKLFTFRTKSIQTLYWLLNRRFTYWFINEVFPTPESPRMITFKRAFFLVPDIVVIEAVFRWKQKNWHPNREQDDIEISKIKSEISIVMVMKPVTKRTNKLKEH